MLTRQTPFPSAFETMVVEAICRILWKMKVGDEIDITLDNGECINFKIETIPKLSGEELARKKLKVELQQLTQRLADALGLPYYRG